MKSGHNLLDYGWSPNGKYLAYTADQDINGKYELYVVPGAGKDPVKVSGELSPFGDVTSFQWSAKGPSLVFLCNKEAAEKHEIFLTNRTGTKTRKISIPLSSAGATVFPDEPFLMNPKGTELVYFAKTGNVNIFDLYRANLKTGLNQKITFFSGPSQFIYDYGWSTKGDYFFYTSNQFANSSFEVFSHRRNDTTVATIVGDIGLNAMGVVIVAPR